MTDTHSDPGASRVSRRPRRRPARLIGALIAAALALTIASTALATLSYYRTGTLEAATTYSSVQRSDWFNNQIFNGHSANISARVWTVNQDTGVTIRDTGYHLLPPSWSLTYSQDFGPQKTRNHCRRNNGGPASSGWCAAHY